VIYTGNNFCGASATVSIVPISSQSSAGEQQHSDWQAHLGDPKAVLWRAFSSDLITGATVVVDQRPDEVRGQDAGGRHVLGPFSARGLAINAS